MHPATGLSPRTRAHLKSCQELAPTFRPRLLMPRKVGASIYQPARRVQRVKTGSLEPRFGVFCRCFACVPRILHRCGKQWISRADNAALRLAKPGFLMHCRSAGLWTTTAANRLGYSCETGAPSASFYDETDLSAERTPAEAQARVPCAHGDACRPRDPEAPPGEGPQAALRLGPRTPRSPRPRLPCRVCIAATG